MTTPTTAIILYNSEIHGAEWLLRFRIALKLGIVRSVWPDWKPK